MDAVSHNICLTSRKDRKNVYSKAIASVITSSIKSRLFRTLERGEQIRLYKYLSRVPDSRATAGIFFEAAAQGYFQGGVTLELLPMVRLPLKVKPILGGIQVLFLFIIQHWKQLVKKALQERQSINIPLHLTIEEYRDDGPSSIKSNVFYVPELTNQVALDSFILMDGLLHSFQLLVFMTSNLGSLTLSVNVLSLYLWTNVVSYSSTTR